MANYGVKQLRTTDGKKYILVRGGKVSLSHRTYYSKKSNALKKAKKLNESM